jgi:hypothetical protein
LPVLREGKASIGGFTDLTELHMDDKLDHLFEK